MLELRPQVSGRTKEDVASAMAKLVTASMREDRKCEALWRAVIAAAVDDYVYPNMVTSSWRNEKMMIDAHKWLTSKTPDIAKWRSEVFVMAGYEPELAQRLVDEINRLPYCDSHSTKAQAPRLRP